MMFALILFAGATPGLMRVEDFGAYWSAAKVNIRGQNPFDHALLLERHREIEPDRQDVLPPWGGPGAIAICYPFIGLPFRVARILWMVTQIVAVIAAASMAWRSYRGPPDRTMRAWFVAFSFYPTLQLISLGQVSIGNLLAVAGFLHFHKSRPYLAGLLCGCVIAKPQNMMPFEWAIILWCLHHRPWKVIAGGLTTVGTVLALIFVPNPHFVSHYLDAITNRGPLDMVQPTPATWLRWATGGAFWPALTLQPLAVVGVTIMYIVRRKTWDWHRELLWLVPLSFFATPYGWMYDVTVFLVPVLGRIATAVHPKRAIGTLLPISLVAFVMNVLDFAEFQFGWFPVAVALWIGAMGKRKPKLA